MLAPAAALASLLAAAPTPQDPAALAEALGAFLEAEARGADTTDARGRVGAALARGVEGGLTEALARAGTPEGPVTAALRVAALPADWPRRTGRVVEGTVEAAAFGKAGLAYALHLPEEYGEDRDRLWPLVVSLPDLDEDPDAHLRTHWRQPALLEGALMVAPELGDDPDLWDHVAWEGRPAGVSRVLTLLAAMDAEHAVDPARVVIVGRGASAGAALAAAEVHPGLFAGAATVAADVDLAQPDNLFAVPLLLAGGGARARAFVERAEAQGKTDARVEADPDLAAWILAAKRDPYPSEVRLWVGKPFPTRAHWLEVSPNDPAARAHGRVDRGRNTVHLATGGITTATLHLADGLVDLSKPVQVHCNGTVHVYEPARSLDTMLARLADGTSAGGSVVTATVVVDTRQDARPHRPGPLQRSLFDRKLESAGRDVAELEALWAWCFENGEEARAADALAVLVDVDPDHGAARAALGHRRVGDHWFPDAVTAAAWSVLQDPERAAVRGWAERDGTWWHPDALGRLRSGLAFDPARGLWLDDEAKERLADGALRQDLGWVPAADAPGHRPGHWFVRGRWVGGAEADRVHGRLDEPWVIPSFHVTLTTTVARSTARWAQAEMAHALPLLEGVFGLAPALPLDVVLLRTEEQADRFAFGDPAGRRRGAHLGQRHTITNAYLAESRFGVEDGARVHRPAGVGVWDAELPDGDAFGRVAARLAYGLAWTDALDPSPRAVKRATGRGPGPDFAEEYRDEKQLPEWLRHGAAVYAARFFVDDRVAAVPGPDQAVGDPLWARRWSLENLARLGGLGDGLEDVFTFDLDGVERRDGQALMLRAGLLVAFVLDGGCRPVQEGHRDLVRELRAGRSPAGAARALEEALRAHVAELRDFAR